MPTVYDSVAWAVEGKGWLADDGKDDDHDSIAGLFADDHPLALEPEHKARARSEGEDNEPKPGKEVNIEEGSDEAITPKIVNDPRSSTTQGSPPENNWRNTV